MMGPTRRLLLLVVWAATAGYVQAATLYRWVGPHGVVTYQATPPPSAAAGVRAIHIQGGPSPGRAHQKVSQHHPVTLYEAPHCGPCTQAQAYLRRRKVAYRAVNVAKSQAALRAMKARTGSMTVPTIVVGKHVLVGYVRSVLAGELAAAGYPAILKSGH